ncbi:MAG TPA: hypothetical protein PLM91_09825 [Bacillota bacterium]|nr:hypothetical protein [Bacillota bacterium]
MEEEKTVNWFARLIGIITAPPVMAGAAAATVRHYDPTLFGDGTTWYLVTLMLLTAIPLFSYVVAYMVPSIRATGRKGQRKLAFIVSVICYVVGAAVCLIAKAPRIVSAFFLSYLASGGLLSLINAAFKFKASGHACGFAGPVTLVSMVIGPVALWAFALLPLVFWARLSMKRHSKGELWSGALVGIGATAVVMLIFP